jgi:predicted nucleic acid-binding protein
MKPKVYIETSVISYLTARSNRNLISAAHQQITKNWWNNRFKYELYVSELVVTECSAGNPDAVNNRLTALGEANLLQTPEKAIYIARNLLARNIMPSKASEDALHIAIATLHSIDFLVTTYHPHPPS